MQSLTAIKIETKNMELIFTHFNEAGHSPFSGPEGLDLKKRKKIKIKMFATITKMFNF